MGAVLRICGSAATVAWTTAEHIVGVKEFAPVTEKAVRVYNAFVATGVFGNFIYKWSKSNYDLRNKVELKKFLFFCYENLSDVAFHVLLSQVSENSHPVIKTIALSADIFRLINIDAFQFTPPPISTISLPFNVVDIGNHVLNIAYNTGVLQKII